jgi:uncharacterized delta-60 repeat protein
MIVFLILLAFGLVFPSTAWPQGGHREAVLVVGDAATAIALQGDGKIVVAGLSDDNAALARYNPEGSLDPSFGDGGKVSPHAGSGMGVSALAIQEDGKIVVTGAVYTSMGSNDFAVARYQPDGRLDPAFGTGGRVTIDLSRDYDEAYALAIQADGKLVVGGLSVSGISLLRYNPDGSLDSSFASTMRSAVSTGTGMTAVHALALQPDGKIVAGGTAEGSFWVARYTAEGGLDPSFGTGGTVITRFGISEAESSTAYDLALQSDGRIVGAGIAYDERDFGFAVVRYTPDGSLDTGLGTGGKVVTAVGVRSDEAHPFGPLYTHKGSCRLCRVALQPDGKIVVAGSALVGGTFDFAVVRYNPDGSLDKSFGTEGIVITAIGDGNDRAYALALQPDGKVVVAGGARIRARETNFALVRYNPDGSLDSSFGKEGKVTTRIGAGVMRS